MRLIQSIALVLVLLFQTNIALAETNFHPQYFSDIPQDHPLYFEVKYLYEMDYPQVTGYEDGTLRPEELINRAEAAVMLYRAYSMSIAGSGRSDPANYNNQIYNKSCYDDVPADQWFTVAVCFGKSRGWFDEGPLFNPSGIINRAEFATMIVRGGDSSRITEDDLWWLNQYAEEHEYQYQDVGNDEWFYPYVLNFVKLVQMYSADQFIEKNYNPSQWVTRGEALAWSNIFRLDEQRFNMIRGYCSPDYGFDIRFDHHYWDPLGRSDYSIEESVNGGHLFIFGTDYHEELSLSVSIHTIPVDRFSLDSLSDDFTLFAESDHYYYLWEKTTDDEKFNNRIREWIIPTIYIGECLQTSTAASLAL